MRRLVNRELANRMDIVDGPDRLEPESRSLNGLTLGRSL